MLLESIVTEETTSAPKILVYGETGSGKTSFLLNAEGLAIMSLDKSGDKSISPKIRICPKDGWSWQKFLKILTDLSIKENTKKLGIEVLAIDTINGAEDLAIEYVCQRDNGATKEHKTWVDGKPNLGGYPWSGGDKVVMSEFRQVINLLEKISSNGVVVVLLCQVQAEKVDNLEGENYKRTAPRATKVVRDSLMEFVDILGYIEIQKIAYKADKEKQNKVKMDSHERTMHLVASGGHFAKNRFAMPDSMPLELGLTFSEVMRYCRENTPENAKEHKQWLLNWANSETDPEKRDKRIKFVFSIQDNNAIRMKEVRGEILAKESTVAEK